MLDKLSGGEETTHEGFHTGKAIMVILLFLAFIGSSFYLMVTNS